MGVDKASEIVVRHSRAGVELLTGERLVNILAKATCQPVRYYPSLSSHRGSPKES